MIIIKRRKRKKREKLKKKTDFRAREISMIFIRIFFQFPFHDIIQGLDEKKNREMWVGAVIQSIQ